MAVVRFRHTFYTPADDVKAVVDCLPDSATRSVDVEIYGLTDMVVINALLSAARRGVQIRVMNDRSQAAGPADHRALETLVAAGLPSITVKVVESERGAIDHLKLMIIDGQAGALDDASSVAFGSFNFSDSAQKQDNVFVHTNDPGEVAQAMAKFDHDWEMNRCLPAWQVTATPATS